MEDLRKLQRWKRPGQAGANFSRRVVPPQVILHGATGSDRRARYTVKGVSGEVKVDYLWGEPALGWR